MKSEFCRHGKYKRFKIVQDDEVIWHCICDNCFEEWVE